jgi:hypothetical protein
LLQKPVDQGGFAMVDVGDNGNVAEIHELCALNRYGPRGGPAIDVPYIVRNCRNSIAILERQAAGRIHRVL